MLVHMCTLMHGWRRDDVLDPKDWTYPLSEAQRRELTALGEETTPLDACPALQEGGRAWRAALRDGLGFVLLRGFPLDLPPHALERAYVAMGTLFGAPAPQNLAGDLLTHVRDTGADPLKPETRLYTTRAEQDFHTDGADVIGLLCLRTAKEGGASRIASSVAIVEQIRRTRPDLHPLLFSDFPWHYQEAGQPAFHFSRPICAQKRVGDVERLNTFFIPWYLRRSQELPEAPRLSAAQHEVIELVERLANDPAFHLDMQFQPGDVQWLKNASILHKRTAYEDHPRPEDKRHLMRLWLSAPDFEDGDEQLRRGVVRAS